MFVSLFSARRGKKREGGVAASGDWENGESGGSRTGRKAVVVVVLGTRKEQRKTPIPNFSCKFILDMLLHVCTTVHHPEKSIIEPAERPGLSHNERWQTKTHKNRTEAFNLLTYASRVVLYLKDVECRPL